MSYGGKCCTTRISNWIQSWSIHHLSLVEFCFFAGLRGAVAFALALLIKQERVESQPMFVTTTIAVIYFTVFVQGITIKPLVRILNVKRASKKKPSMNERIHERVMSIESKWKFLDWFDLFLLQLIDHLMAGMEDVVGKTGNYNMRDKFKRFDQKFIRPFLLKNAQVNVKAICT